MNIFWVFAAIGLSLSFYTGLRARRKWRHGDYHCRDYIIMCIFLSLYTIFCILAALYNIQK